MQGRRGLDAVDALAMTEEDVLRLEAVERASWRNEPEQWMHSERLTARDEITGAAERIAAGQDPFGREPERDLPPPPPAQDRPELERGPRRSVPRSHVQRDAEPLCDRGAISAVAIHKLDDPRRLAERANPFVDSGTVDDIDQPDPAAGEHGV